MSFKRKRICRKSATLVAADWIGSSVEGGQSQGWALKIQKLFKNKLSECCSFKLFSRIKFYENLTKP